MLIVVFGDIFRSPDLSGWGKALWTIFVIFLPYLGVFVYLIARGRKMQEHAVQAAQAQDAAMRQYVQNVAGTAVAALPTRSPDSPSSAIRASSARPSSNKPRRRRCPDRRFRRRPPPSGCETGDIGSPRRRPEIERSPADVLRLVVAAALLLVLLLVERVFGNTLVGFASDLLRGLDAVPQWIVDVVVVGTRVLAVVVLGGLLAWALYRRRWRMLGTVALAGLLAAAVVAGCSSPGSRPIKARRSSTSASISVR